MRIGNSMANFGYRKCLKIMLLLTGALCVVSLCIFLWIKIYSLQVVNAGSLGSPLNWSGRHLADLILNAPGEFQDMPVDLGSLAEVLVDAKGYKYTSHDLEIQVIRNRYKDGVDLSLAGSVQGAVDGVARTPGLRNFKHKEWSSSISAKPAMRVSISANRYSDGIRMEGLTILDGQTLYQVELMFRSGDLHESEYIGKILDSARIDPGTN